MFKNLSTLNQVLLILGVTNALMILGVVGLEYRFELDEKDFLVLTVLAGTTNFIWVWALLRKSFKVVEDVANNLQRMATRQTAVKHGYEKATKFKLKTAGHQKEVQELVDAFNNLVDEIHDKAEESTKIIHAVSKKNGD